MALKNSEPSIFNELGNLFKNPTVLVFVFWCIGAGMCTGVVWNFLFLYTEELATGDQKEHIQTLQGLLTGVQCFLGELPFNFIAGNVLKKLGHINVMSLVLLAYAIRFDIVISTFKTMIFTIFNYIQSFLNYNWFRVKEIFKNSINITDSWPTA